MPMRRTTAARTAGFTYLLYIVLGIGSMAGAFRWAPAGLVGYAQNASAVVLALTLFMVTRDEQPAIAALGMIFRIGEGTIGGITALAGVTLAHPTVIDATLFAVGSTCFCWLLLRGRMIPSGLAWLGLIASIVLVVGLPLQLGGRLGAPTTTLMWMPMLAFEIPAGLWLLVRGVPSGRRHSPTRSAV
jgi:hypothetical protein